MAAGLHDSVPVSRLVLTYRQPLVARDGRSYTTHAWGRRRDDGTWEGWLEFSPYDGTAVLRSARETTQPNLRDLEYWASGLSPVYREGALERALAPSPATAVRPGAPAADEDPGAPEAEGPMPEPILDPFSVYANGEALLRRQLAALSPRHLRAIIRAYGLALAPRGDLEAMTRPELIGLIVTSVHSRLTP